MIQEKVIINMENFASNKVRFNVFVTSGHNIAPIFHASGIYLMKYQHWLHFGFSSERFKIQCHY